MSRFVEVSPLFFRLFLIIYRFYPNLLFYLPRGVRRREGELFSASRVKKDKIKPF